ncbi:MAG: hypothetical protein ACON35_05335 [Candidatus Marinamargulisbacteria bacterium]
MIKTILMMIMLFGNVIFSASLHTGIGQLSMGMPGNPSVPNQATTFGVGIVNDYPYQNHKALQLSFYYQVTQNNGRIVLDELVLKIGGIRQVSPRMGYGFGVQLNHVLASDFDAQLLPSNGIGFYIDGYYQALPQLRLTMGVASLNYTMGHSYSAALISNEIRFGLSTNL